MARARSVQSQPSDGVGLFGTDRPGGLHERVYRSLLHAIVSGRFAKGSKLPSEPELAAAYGVSRPVVRQALDKIRGDGLIESLRGSGSYVTGLDHLVTSARSSLVNSPVHAKAVLDDLEFRLIFEPEAAFLAAKRRGPNDLSKMTSALRQFEDAYASGQISHHYDYLFHEAIALSTTNARLVDAARTVEYSQDDERLLMRQLVHFQPGARGAEVIREHELVLDLIQQRDAPAARDAMSRHISSSRQRLVDYLRKMNVSPQV
jgi:GntR family transcriptional regulator, transcriptional repressor for pyruvate dehydrogenase complex